VSPRSAAAEAALGLSAMILFIVYFGVHCFRYPMVGDFGRHCASVASLYRNFLHPLHEAMPVPGTQSEVHTPYIVAVAAFGRALGVTPYRALQLAGVANLVFYAWSVWFFFRAFSVLRRSWVAPAAFLLVSLFLRNRLFWWASETSFASVRWIQAYPSFFAWGVALTGFALAERFFRRPRAATLVGIAFLIWTLLLSHNLTATWMIGILLLRGIWEVLADRSAVKPAAAMGFAVASGVVLTLLWPYFDILRSPGLLRIPEGSEFGDHPFRDMAGLYAVALPAAAGLLVLRRHGFWIAAFAATFLALQVFRALGFDYANRYAFFQAFFAQAFVAEAIGLAAAVLRRDREELQPKLSNSPLLRSGFVLLGAAALVLTATAPVVREERRDGRPLLPFRALFDLPPAHDAYYARLGEVGNRLKESDVVMMPVEHAAWDVASITGARVVASLFAYRVPDFPARALAVHRFFAPEADRRWRGEILRRYGVTKVLLTPTVADRDEDLRRFLGPAVARTASFALFESPAALSERLRQRDGIAHGPPVIQLGHAGRVAVAHQPPLVDPDRPAAVLAHGRERVRHQKDGLARRPEFLHPRVALHLEPLVADRQRLVHEQDVRLDVGRDREGEPRRHARRVGPNGRVDELLQLRPLDDSWSPAPHFGAREAEQRALEHDVLASRQLAVESEAELEKRGGPADDDDASGARRHDPRDQTQKRALARAIASDDADRLAAGHLEGDLSQRFELVEVEPPLEPPDRVLLERPDSFPRDPITHRYVVEQDRGAHLSCERRNVPRGLRRRSSQ
jgi:hypothetical protein